MRLYINEIIKAFYRKSVLAAFLGLALLNGVLLWIYESRQDIFYTPAQYKAVYEDLQGETTQAAYERMRTAYQKLCIFERMSYGEDFSELLEEAPSLDEQTLWEEYEAEEYLVYTGHLYSELVLVTDIYAEVAGCYEYEEYLKGIDEQAAQLAAVSLFADPDSFSYKNIVKTPQAFSHLKGSYLQAGPSKGIATATGFLATDLIALLMILAVVVTIVTREKEQNQLLLTRTTCKGRTGLGVVKLLTCFTAALFAELLLYAVNFAVAFQSYGVGNLNRQLQSVYAFRGSNLGITVLEYLVLFLLVKLVVYCTLAAVMFLITVCFDKAVQVYIALAAVMGAEATLYASISGTSYLCLLKYINLVAYTDVRNLLTVYQNRNLFGQPVNAVPVFAVTISVLFLVCTAAAVMVFSKRGVVRNVGSWLKRIRPRWFSGRTDKLFFHECYKILIGGKVFWILLLFGAARWFFYTPMSEGFASVDDIYYKHYMLELEGVYNQASQAYLEEEEARYAQIMEEMAEMLEGAGDDNWYVLMKYQEKLAPQKAFYLVQAHAEYLKRSGGEFVYDLGYQLLTGHERAGNMDIQLALLAAVMIVCCTVYVYTVEYQNGMNGLIRTTLYGRKRTFLYKLLISVTVVTVVYAITYGPYFFNVFVTYGSRGLAAPACSMEHLEGWSISIGQYLILISVMRYGGLLLAMLLMFWLSAKLKSGILAMLTGAALLVLPLLLSLLGLKVFDYCLLNPLLLGNVWV